MSRDLYTLDDLPPAFDDRPVLVRVDFNVPMKDGRVSDDTRLREALPTLRELRERGARLVLVSHRGRPKGERDPKLSLEPVADALSSLLDQPVVFGSDCVGEPRREAIDRAREGGFVLLENLRFHAGETKDDAELAQQLSEGCVAYVDDAFGAVHRAHASVSAVAALFEQRAAGRLVEREVAALGRLLESPERPFVGILGGAKISGKIDTLTRLLDSLDLVVLGGGMANTFLAARGIEMARSLVEQEAIGQALEILRRAEQSGVEVVLPEDVVVTDDLDADSPRAETHPVGELPEWAMAVDLGPRTVETIRSHVAAARTVFWNGPLGVFERPPFERASLEVARAIAEASAYTVAGGGETAAVARQAEVIDRLDHLSTGGGASLEFLAGRDLPGLAVLRRPS